MSDEAKDAAAGANKNDGDERIARRLARAGLCSRREAERWIEQGRVVVDGVKLTSPAFNVGPGALIVVDGQPLPEAERPRLWRYHKPAGLVTSHKDPQGRPTLFDNLPDDLPRVISVGRLDLTSEGLLLLTNDGALARRLELPATGWIRKYRVRVHGAPDEAALTRLEKGITVEGVEYGPIKATLDRTQGANAWLTLTLKEGKNREVRNVMSALGCTVNRLIRVAYGPFQLGLIKPGQVEEVPARLLREQLGLKTDGGTAVGLVLPEKEGPPRSGSSKRGPYKGDPGKDAPARGGPRKGAPQKDGPRKDSPHKDGPRKDGKPAHRRG